MRYDEDGRIITMRPSSQRCTTCRRVFAAGHLPLDGTLICRDCRDDGLEPAQSPLFAVSPYVPERGGDVT